MVNPFAPQQAAQPQQASPFATAPAGGSPFAQAPAGAPAPSAFAGVGGRGPAAPSADEFGQASKGPTGKYPKPEDLNGCLLAFNVGAAEFSDEVDPFANKERMKNLAPGQPVPPPVMRRRAVVDTFIVDGKEPGAHASMWWSTGPLVKELEKQHQRGQGWLLGRLRKVPFGATRKAGITTAAELEAEIARLAAAGDLRGYKELSWTWALTEFSAADAAAASAFIAANPI